MLKFKSLVFLLVLIGLTACKSSPTADEEGDSLALAPVATSEESSAESSEEQQQETEEPGEPVTSTADTSFDSKAEQSEYNVQPGEFNLYPRETSGWDESGWSIITPSEDTRLIYVSSSLGDDETAEFYAPRDIGDIQDPGLIKPFKTIEAAMTHARDGFPDWVLLLKGDNWDVHEKISLPGGRSVSQRFVLTSYGNSSNRPEIRSSASEALRIWVGKKYIALMGISLYAPIRDPGSVDFSGWGNVKESIGLRAYTPADSVVGSILLENNSFNFFSKGISMSGGGKFVDIVVRRNIIENSYSEKNHSQGMYAGKSSLMLEENIFYHNGWYKQQVDSGNEKTEGQATMFNHNTYFPKSEGTTFRKNIFISSSSMHNKFTADSKSEDSFDSIQAKNIVVDSNVYIGGEVGISAGGNTDYDTGHRWQNITISNNIMFAIGQDQPTNRTLGWYVDATDWDGGVICGNYLLHNNNAEVTNLIGVKVSGHSSDVTVRNNLITGLINENTAPNAAALLLTGDEFENIQVEGNLIQMKNSKLRPIRVNSLEEINFKNNTYFSNAEIDDWFRVGTTDYNFSDWQLISNEVGATNTAVEVIVPERSIDSYASSLGLSFEQLKENLLDQSRDLWQQEYTVDSIAGYIRDGYGSYNCD